MQPAVFVQNYCRDVLHGARGKHNPENGNNVMVYIACAPFG